MGHAEMTGMECQPHGEPRCCWVRLSDTAWPLNTCLRNNPDSMPGKGAGQTRRHMVIFRRSTAGPLGSTQGGMRGQSWWNCPALSHPLGAAVVALPRGSVFAGRALPWTPSGMVRPPPPSAGRLVSGYSWHLYSGASLGFWSA